MEENKTEIRICLGSSCFARGNKKMVQVIQQFLTQNHLEEKVIFHGAHCFGHCGDGPMLKIDDNLILSNDPDEMKRLLKNHFGL
jgi:NADH:ubiquinone oxidoreductase subunit E